MIFTAPLGCPWLDLILKDNSPKDKGVFLKALYSACSAEVIKFINTDRDIVTTIIVFPDGGLFIILPAAACFRLSVDGICPIAGKLRFNGCFGLRACVAGTAVCRLFVGSLFVKKIIIVAPAKTSRKTIIRIVVFILYLLTI
ncbi:MAG: hypothetical protein HUN04_18130 [Desulfobacter sp.]|nr:MAG: hypothetical protein HUN04_18130 [Desulfobacter sp.]